jgi:hypothetical protein
MIQSILMATCDHGCFCFGTKRCTNGEFRKLRERKMVEKGKRT